MSKTINDIVREVVEGEGEDMKCKDCGSKELYPMDTDDYECNCGALYCGNCDAELTKEGELLAYGIRRG